MLLLLLVLVSTGCAVLRIPTHVTGFKDPAFQQTTFQKPLICVAGENLALKETAETDAVNTFRTQGIDAGRCMDVFLPTRVYNSSDIAHIISVAGYDSVMLVRRTDTSSSQTYVPGTGSHTYGTATQSPAFIQNFGMFSVVHGGGTSYQSQTYTDPGYTVSRTSVGTSVQFYDLKTQQMAWVGSAETAGPSARNPREFVYSIAEAVRDELIKNGLLRPSREPHTLELK